jgi:hypothetical protein
VPTRKQRRREAKSKRHEYEFVYVDDEGNEVEAPADEPKSRNGSKPAAAAAKKHAPQGRRLGRAPQPPSWRRAAKRSSLIGAFLLVFVSVTSKGKVLSVLPVAIGFSLLYVPAMYYMDRAMYRRWVQRQQQPATKKR